MSRDHSVVEDMVEKGDLTRDEARHHPRRNLITRALGTEPGVAADAFPLKWQQGDFLLLCSDGLINTVSDQEASLRGDSQRAAGHVSGSAAGPLPSAGSAG